MDCGRYDRAAVSDRELEEADALRLSKIRLEEEEMMTLRPITTDKVGGKVVYEQDTSLPDGFLRKLGKQDEKKFKKVGILSPEEGAGMFADLGNNMFGNKEDRDLIEGITGKGDSSGNRESRSKVASSFSKEGDDEDLLASLRSQLGANNLADISSIPDILDPTGDKKSKSPVAPVPVPSKKGSGAPVTGPSIFDTRAETKGPRETSPAPSSSSSASSSVSSSVSAFTREAVPVAVRPDPVDQFETPVTPQYGPALTTQEAEKLQDSLDDMTDDEVAAVLAKLRSAVSDRIKEEVSDAMMASGISRANSMPNGNGGEIEPKKMPRAPSVNPEVREKFDKELSAIEDELEKIYSDPLGTWQEMMANPEKFLEENEIGLLTGGGDDK
jgi:hypothetical protein